MERNRHERFTISRKLQPCKSSKLVSAKGIKEVNIVTSSEKRVLVTTTVNACPAGKSLSSANNGPWERERSWKIKNKKITGLSVIFSVTETNCYYFLHNLWKCFIVHDVRFGNSHHQVYNNYIVWNENVVWK